MKEFLTKHKTPVIIIAACLLVALAFVAGMAVKSSPDAGSDIGMEQAKTIALESVGVSSERAVFTKTEAGKENGDPVYEIEFHTGVNEYEFEIHGLTGEILEKKSEPIDPAAAQSIAEETQETAENSSQTEETSTSQGQNAQSTNYIGIEKAKRIALKQAGLSSSSGVSFTKAHLDSDDGTQVYEIEFIAQNTEYNCEIHAYTGEILECETEHAYDH